MANFLDENDRKDLYRKMLADNATSESTKKYSFKQFETKILGDDKLLNKLSNLAVKRDWAIDQEDFFYKYAPEKLAKTQPQPQVQEAPAMQVAAPVEEQRYTPPPQPLIGSPEYDVQLQSQYGGMKPTLGATFGGAAASFETPEQKKQEQLSPAFKAQQLAFEDVPIASEQRKAQRRFAKLTKQEKEAAFRGGTGFELQQKRANEQRDATKKLKDFGSYLGVTFDNMINKLAAAEALFGAKQRSLLTFGEKGKKAEEQEKVVKQQVLNYLDQVDQDFAAKQAEYNIEGNIYDVISKGQLDRLPEAFAYNLAQIGINALGAGTTGGYSTFAQVVPDMYKAGVEEIARKTNTTPEEVIASGKDKEVIAYTAGAISGGIDYFSSGLLGSAMRSKGAYKFLRDFILNKIGKTKWKQAAASAAALGGVANIEAFTEGGQGLVEVAAPQVASAKSFKEARENIYGELQKPSTQRRLASDIVGGAAGGGGLVAGGRGLERVLQGDFTYGDVRKSPASQRADMDIVQTDNKIQERNKIAQAMEEAVKGNPEAEGQIREQYQKRVNEAAPTDEEVLAAYEGLALLPETEEKNTIRENLEAYMAEKGIQPEAAGMEAGLGEGLRVPSPEEAPVIRTVNPQFPPPQITSEPVAPEPVAPEVTPEPIAPTEEAPTTGMFEGIEGPTQEATPIAPTEEVVTIAPLNIEFSKNEGRNVNYQGIEGRIKIDSDGAPYIFTRDGDVVYIEGGLSGQTPQQLGVQPLADDVINEADIETVLEDETAPLDQNQLQYDFDNNTITLYGRPFSYEGVETNSKGQTTALRLRDANGKIKFVRNEDTILEFEIQKELYEKSRTNKQPTIESATAAAEQLQVVPINKVEQVSEPIQQEGSTSDTKGDKVAPAPKGRKKAAPITPPAPKVEKPQLKKEETPKPEAKEEKPSKEERIAELEKEKSALTSKALKQFPNSPNQLKTRKRIDEINKELDELNPKEAKPTTGTPQEGDAVEIAPQREGGSPRKMVFKDGEWKQNVGGDIVKVGPSVQGQAQEMFAGKTETKAEGTKGGAKESLGKRLKGDALLDAEDTLAELSDNGATINPDGTVVVYHRTSKDKADAIVKNNEMFGLEDGVFFSTSEKGQAEGYGDVVVKMNVPIEQIQIDDTFGNEAHVRIPTKKANQKISVSKFSPQVLSAETKAETTTQAEFTSKQESSASTEFDGTKKPSKIKTKSFDGKHGKGAFERMKNITDNFEDIMDGLSEKIKQDCL